MTSGASVHYLEVNLLKLYNFTSNTAEYWETWDNDDGSHSFHWGELGTRGEFRTVRAPAGTDPTTLVKKQIDNAIALGFKPINVEHHYTLLIEFAVDGMGSADDVEKRHRLENRMNETLGWTGLGVCDGGSIGSGSMEVCNFVVDFDVAKRVIEEDLANTEFANYKRIFDENAQR